MNGKPFKTSMPNEMDYFNLAVRKGPDEKFGFLLCASCGKDLEAIEIPPPDESGHVCMQFKIDGKNEKIFGHVCTK